jgi:hypothetical protein
MGKVLNVLAIELQCAMQPSIEAMAEAEDVKMRSPFGSNGVVKILV